jgi:hypothetical protein
MQPQQPYQQPPQYPPQPAPAPGGNTGQGDYDFILNPDKPPKKSGLSFGGSPKVGRIILILGGLFVAVIIIAVIMSATKNSGFDKPTMLAVAQDQTEILRLVDYGTKNAQSQTLTNFNATAAASIKSDRAAYLVYVATNGLKPKATDLDLKHDATVDTQLTSAISASTFDATYKSLMDKELSEYQADLSAAYKKVGPKGQAVLKSQFNNAKLLRVQLDS